MKRDIAEIFEKYGVTPKAAKAAGIYPVYWAHRTGLRTIGLKALIRYEKLFGIPRWELRPDLWEKPRA